MERPQNETERDCDAESQQQGDDGGRRSNRCAWRRNPCFGYGVQEKIECRTEDQDEKKRQNHDCDIVFEKGISGDAAFAPFFPERKPLRIIRQCADEHHPSAGNDPEDCNAESQDKQEDWDSDDEKQSPES